MKQVRREPGVQPATQGRMQQQGQQREDALRPERAAGRAQTTRAEALMGRRETLLLLPPPLLVQLLMPPLRQMQTTVAVQRQEQSR